MSFLVKAAAQNLSYEAIDWVEGWISDIKNPPEAEIREELDKAALKPKGTATLYRGLSQGEYKSLQAMMKKEFGKLYQLSDHITLTTKGLTSWSKTREGAALFAYGKTLGGVLQKRLQGFVVEAKIKPDQILLDITKVKGINSALKEDVRQEKEIIVLPGTIQGKIVSISKQTT